MSSQPKKPINTKKEQSTSGEEHWDELAADPEKLKSTNQNNNNQQEVTDKGFTKNNGLNVSIKDGKITIEGMLYSKQKFNAEKLSAYIDKEFSGKFDVDGKAYTFDINLEYTMWEGESDISLTAVRGLPPIKGGLFYRSNAEHGGSNITLSMYERNVQKTAAHEFMHILGFSDTYRDTAKGSVSLPGHQNDIMGSPNGNIQNYHIRTLLKNYKD